jgi:hypothetical protein
VSQWESVFLLSLLLLVHTFLSTNATGSHAEFVDNLAGSIISVTIALGITECVIKMLLSVNTAELTPYPVIVMSKTTVESTMSTFKTNAGSRMPVPKRYFESGCGGIMLRLEDLCFVILLYNLKPENKIIQIFSIFLNAPMFCSCFEHYIVWI